MVSGKVPSPQPGPTAPGSLADLISLVFMHQKGQVLTLHQSWSLMPCLDRREKGQGRAMGLSLSSLSHLKQGSAIKQSGMTPCLQKWLELLKDRVTVPEPCRHFTVGLPVPNPPHPPLPFKPTTCPLCRLHNPQRN